jgi:hypothetical protein
MRFDSRRGRFLLRYRPDPSIQAPTEIFLPELQFPGGYRVETEGCTVEPGEPGARRGCLLVRARPGFSEARVMIIRKKGS